jgi:hypothetical protein
VSAVAVPDINEFWFALDNRFLFHPTPEIGAAYGTIQMPDGITNLRIEHRANGTYPAGFEEDVTPMRDGLELLSVKQLEIFDLHLGDDPGATRQAFEEFGQGIHFDDRRPVGQKIHMMDASGPANPAVGFHRWHAIIRAQVVLGIAADRWTEIDRCLGLGWAIQSEAQPVQQVAAPNPPLAPERVAALCERWMARTPEAIDDAFDSIPFPVDAEVPDQPA